MRISKKPIQGRLKQQISQLKTFAWSEPLRDFCFFYPLITSHWDWIHFIQPKLNYVGRKYTHHRRLLDRPFPVCLLSSYNCITTGPDLACPNQEPKQPQRRRRCSMNKSEVTCLAHAIHWKTGSFYCRRKESCWLGWYISAKQTHYLYEMASNQVPNILQMQSNFTFP